MRLFNAAPVTFRTTFLKSQCYTVNLSLRIGDDVIVETPRGPLIGRITDHVQRRMLPSHEVYRVVRRATASDVDQATKNEERENEAYRFAIDRIRTRHMKMKLVRAQYMQDGSKIVFYFSADGRIDFRDLVKDLAQRFHTRIEMHQIGVRDGARMLGGIGPCGRELCCSTFLEDFAPVSIRMAKDQGLTLNPKKVSGMCGRLMCCLVYEQQIYKSIRRRLPRPGTRVFTAHGEAVVLSIDVLSKRLTLEYPDTNTRTLELMEVSLGPVETPKTPPSEPDADYLWDDLLAQVSEAEDEDVDLVLSQEHEQLRVAADPPLETSQRSIASSRKRVRRRPTTQEESRSGRRGRKKSATTTPDAGQEKNAADASKRRRLRRRKSSKDESPGE